MLTLGNIIFKKKQKEYPQRSIRPKGVKQLREEWIPSVLWYVPKCPDKHTEHLCDNCHNLRRFTGEGLE